MNEPRQFLLSCLHGDSSRLAVDALPGTDSQVWDELVELARRQRVRPLLFHEFERRGLARVIPTRILEALGQAYRKTALRNLSLLVELGQIARALTAAGAPVIVLKGAYLIGAVYRDLGLREISDLDILVRPEHLQRSVETLCARGYKPLQSFSIKDELATLHHLTPLVKTGFARIEIHWNITPPLDAHAIDPEELWRRAVPWSSGNAPTLALCLEDLLLHLCFHTSFQHHFRIVGLRPCCDISRILVERGPSIDWSVLIQRARAWNWTKGVYLSLRLARELVGAAVPEAALHALHPNGVEDGVLEAASDQIFAPVYASLPADIARLADREPSTTRLKNISRRLLMAQGGAAVRRPPLPRSFRRVWRSLARGGHLLRTHGRFTLQLLLNTNPALTASAQRTNRIRSWLDVD